MCGFERREKSEERGEKREERDERKERVERQREQSRERVHASCEPLAPTVRRYSSVAEKPELVLADLGRRSRLATVPTAAGDAAVAARGLPSVDCAGRPTMYSCNSGKAAQQSS